MKSLDNVWWFSKEFLNFTEQFWIRRPNNTWVETKSCCNISVTNLVDHEEGPPDWGILEWSRYSQLPGSESHSLSWQAGCHAAFPSHRQIRRFPTVTRGTSGRFGQEPLVFPTGTEIKEKQQNVWRRKLENGISCKCVDGYASTHVKCQPQLKVTWGKQNCNAKAKKRGRTTKNRLKFHNQM